MALETGSVVDAPRSEMQRRNPCASSPPSETLPEHSVAQTFDVARPTVKAAIEQLLNPGLLRRSRNETPASRGSTWLTLWISIYRALLSRTRLYCCRLNAVTFATGASEPLNHFRAMIKQKDKVAELVKCGIDFLRALVIATWRLNQLHASVVSEAHLSMLPVQAYHPLHPQGDRR
jgi:hypothetical protein